jgi:siroheme synthase-like protein
VADDPEASDFIVPSVLRRGDLTIAVSTGGKSPALARKVRTRLEESFGMEYAVLLSQIEEVRSTVREKGMDVDAETWRDALDLDLLIELVREGQNEKVKTLLLDQFKCKIDI